MVIKKLLTKNVITFALLIISIGFTHAQNVGIGILQPTNKLHVIGSAATANNATIYAINNGSAGNGIYGISNAQNTNGVQGLSTNGTGIYGYSNSFRGVAGATIGGTALYGNSITGYGLEVSGKIKISGGNTNPENGAVLTSDAVGNAVWKPRRVAFKVSGVVGAYNEVPNESARRIQFESEAFDLGNDYQLLAPNTVPTFSNSSVFTAPLSGIYHFDVSVHLNGGSIQDIEYARVELIRNRNGVETSLAMDFARRVYASFSAFEVPDAAGFSISVTEQLLNGDKLYVVIYQLSGTSLTLNAFANTTLFSGHLVLAD